MTNEQQYKTPEERVKAFMEQRQASSIATAIADEFARWLSLESKDKIEPCPFCGGYATAKHLIGGFCVECSCGYSSGFYEHEHVAIAMHNRVAHCGSTKDRTIEHD